MTESNDQPGKPLRAIAPPFGIIHLMTLTAGLAILFAANELWKTLVSDGSMPLSGIYQIFSFGSALRSGIGLAGLYWLWDWRRRSGAFQFQPGHWLLIRIGLTVLVTTPASLVLYSFYDFNNLLRSQGFYFLITASWNIVPLFIAVIAFWRTKEFWRWLFAALAVLLTIDTLLTFFLWTTLNSGAIGMTANGLILIFTLGLIINDLIKGHQRDWIHFAGLLSFVLGRFIQIGWGIYIMFIFRP